MKSKLGLVLAVVCALFVGWAVFSNNQSLYAFVQTFLWLPTYIFMLCGGGILAILVAIIYHALTGYEAFAALGICLNAFQILFSGFAAYLVGLLIEKLYTKVRTAFTHTR